MRCDERCEIKECERIHCIDVRHHPFLPSIIVIGAAQLLGQRILATFFICGWHATICYFGVLLRWGCVHRILEVCARRQIAEASLYSPRRGSRLVASPSCRFSSSAVVVSFCANARWIARDNSNLCSGLRSVCLLYYAMLL